MTNMNNIMRIGKRAAAAVTFFVALTSSFAAMGGPRDDQVATVTVYKQVLPSSVTYTYSVTNNGEYPITGVSIGFDYYHGTSELGGTLPINALRAPTSWTGRIITLEESANFELRWETISQNALLPGQTITGFRVTLPQEDQRYVNSHWTVIVQGSPTFASSLLQQVATPPLDTVPPQVSVSVSPAKMWPPNNKMVEIHATVTAIDDQDPNPAVRLVSIACNECPNPDTDIEGADIGTDDRVFSVRAARLGQRKDGRVYTVTYSATDTSGNTATAQAQVVVPHDQGK
jgi:hypothetical protein